MKIISLKKQLGDFKLNISELIIKPGITHGFIGVNGSGKTTLAKLIMGILEPDEGQIHRGKWSMSDITLTSQRPYLIHDSLYENIIYPLKIRNISGKENEIDEYLKLLGLQDKKFQYAPSLSSGERQKVSLIRALIFEPKLIIIDESLSNMDMSSVEIFEDLIIERQKKGGSCILITHQMAHIYKLCQEVHYFENGSVMESGSTEKIFHETDDDRIKKYIKSQTIEVVNK